MQGVPLRARTVLTKRQQSQPEKEDGILKSMRLLLTWLSEYPGLYRAISAYVKPEDFTDSLYREVAEMLYEQLEKGELNPARITSHFTDPEQQRIVAQIFNTKIRAENQTEQEKAIRESIYKVVNYGITQKTKELEPTDIQGLQKLIQARKRLQELGRLHISL